MAAAQPIEPSASPDAIHVAILRTVRPGREQDFERLIQDFFQEAAQQAGVCGAYLIRPFAGGQSREYGILRSFASAEARDSFYASDLYRRWNEAVAPLVQGTPQRQDLHGMEAFFRAGHAVAPPLWKMALVTWLGVDVAVYVFSNVIPALVTLPGLLSMLVVNAFVVAALTWVIMPLLTKLFGGWLSRSP